MRKIKHRGIQISTNNWLVGDLIRDNKQGCYLYPEDTEGLYKENRIIPESHGEFSGLYDKKEREIYEGDIVRWERDNRLYCVVFRRGMFYASVAECNDNIYGGFPLWMLCEEEQHCEIVGNVHENPELLKRRRDKK